MNEKDAKLQPCGMYEWERCKVITVWYVWMRKMQIYNSVVCMNEKDAKL